MLFLVVIFVPVDVNSSPDLIKPQDSIVVISHIPQLGPTLLELNLLNNGDEDATIHEIIETDLVLKSESNFSLIEDKDSVKLERVDNTMNIARGETEKIIWNLRDVRFDEGTYTGKVIINGENFESIVSSVIVSFKVSPWIIVLFNSIGIVIALIIGWWLTQREAETKTFQKYKKSFVAFMHVSEHVGEINQMRAGVQTEQWVKMKQVADEHIDEITKKVRNMELSDNFESVQWVERFHKSIEKKYFEQTKQHDKNPPVKIEKITKILSEMISQASSRNLDEEKERLEKILNQINNDSEKQVSLDTNNFIAKRDIPKKRANYDKIFAMNEKTQVAIIKNCSEIPKKSIKESEIQKLKIRDYRMHNSVFLAVITILTSLTAIFVLDFFVGPLWMNILMAIGTGFGAYRSKDFKRLISNE